jgi:hypothetical protein
MTNKGNGKRNDNGKRNCNGNSDAVKFISGWLGLRGHREGR